MKLLSNTPRRMLPIVSFTVGLASIGTWVFAQKTGDSNRGKHHQSSADTATQNAVQLVTQGQQIFRFDTFGDEAFWGGALQLHQAIEGAAFGGVGPGVSPKTALALGLKIDVDALPERLVQQLRHGQVNLEDPAVTLALLKLNAVVGVKGSFNPDGSLQAVGLTCAVCLYMANSEFECLEKLIGPSLPSWWSGPKWLP
jgi:hypothetical protein